MKDHWEMVRSIPDVEIPDKVPTQHVKDILNWAVNVSETYMHVSRYILAQLKTAVVNAGSSNFLKFSFTLGEWGSYYKALEYAETWKLCQIWLAENPQPSIDETPTE